MNGKVVMKAEPHSAAARARIMDSAKHKSTPILHLLDTGM